MSRKTLTPAQRRSEILRLLTARQGASIEELCEFLSASPATIRRDLDLLESEAPIQRTHGGAMMRTLRPADQDFAQREALDVDEKRAIAETVVSLIQPGSTLFMNDGSTIMAVAHAIVAADLEVFVTTSAVNVATRLSAGSKVTSCLLGGIVRQSSLATAGNFTAAMAAQINADMAIISPDGVHAESGITFQSGEDAALAQRMSAQSTDTVIVAVASKLQQRQRIQSMPLTARCSLVTGAAEDQLSGLRETGVRVIRVGTAG
jgi:DeoR/GlpR family transcriptional regulator of sugar metabolism